MGLLVSSEDPVSHSVQAGVDRNLFVVVVVVEKHSKMSFCYAELRTPVS